MTNAMICKVDDCSKPVACKGFCNPHYQRNRNYGDPLGGTDPLKTLKFYQEVVLNFDSDECLPWPFGKDDDGYGRLVTGSDHRRVHVRICEHRNGKRPTPKHHAAHNCGNSSCVNGSHLQWKLPIENEADKVAHGTVAKGERHGRSKVTRADIIKVWTLKKTGLSHGKIAKELPVTESAIDGIIYGRTWKWLSVELGFLDG